MTNGTLTRRILRLVSKRPENWQDQVRITLNKFPLSSLMMVYDRDAEANTTTPEDSSAWKELIRLCVESDKQKLASLNADLARWGSTTTRYELGRYKV